MSKMGDFAERNSAKVIPVSCEAQGADLAAESSG
jgi:hypothetical protein